jgi:hypothetical protein
MAKVQEIRASFENVLMTRVLQVDNARADFLASLESVIDEEIEDSDQ